MKFLIKTITVISLASSCNSKVEQTNRLDPSEELVVRYTGDADVVQFKMFEGLSQELQRDSITGDFKGVLEIPNLNEAIFTYEIQAQRKDSIGGMIEFKPSSTSLKLNEIEAIESGDRFIWVGKIRDNNYLKNEQLKGSLITKIVTSEFLVEEREITVYTPKEVSKKTPYIYFTDGAVVKSYAAYIDRLISTKRIKPIKLIGVHSSSSNRYKEYVEGGDDNELFRKHQSFFYNEVIGTIEKETENWEGDRYLYGFSNGAAFCLHAGINNPNVFKQIIAFSTADYISPMAQWINPIKFEFNEYPKFYIGAGRYEDRIFKNTVDFLPVLEENGIEVHFKEFISGHDYNVWRIEFLEYLENQFKR